jgi:hypothetical protein
MLKYSSPSIYALAQAPLTPLSEDRPTRPYCLRPILSNVLPKNFRIPDLVTGLKRLQFYRVEIDKSYILVPSRKNGRV